MLKKIFALVAASLVSAQAHAVGAELRLANETAEADYLTRTSTFGYGGADMGLGVFFNEQDDLQFNAGIMITGNSAGNNRSWKFGVGAKLLFADLDVINDSVGALAVGAQVRYVIPSSTPVAFLVEGFIAPQIVSFSGAEQFREYRVALELEVTPSARAYVGFRHMEYEVENLQPDYELDDNGHVGIRIEF